MITMPAIGASAQPERSRRAGRRAAPGAFAALVTEASAETSAAPTAPLRSVAGLEGLLGIQEAGDGADERRRAAIGYGNDLLDRLEGLRRRLLAGSVARSELEALAQTLRGQHGRCGAEAIDAVVAAIELRVEVELAKLGCAP
jgi:hypothetical protein